jgi:hypothetical protein
METVNIQQVQGRAYHLWLKDKTRSAEENWDLAEKQLKEEAKKNKEEKPQLPQEIVDSILFKWGDLEHPLAKGIKKECCRTVEKRMHYFSEEQVRDRVKYWSNRSSNCSSIRSILLNGNYGPDGVISANPSEPCHRCRVCLRGEDEGVLRVKDILLWSPKRHMNGKKVVCDCGNRKLVKGDEICWVCCKSDFYTFEDTIEMYGFHKNFPRFFGRYF